MWSEREKQNTQAENVYSSIFRISDFCKHVTRALATNETTLNALGFEKECKLCYRVEKFFLFRSNRRQQEHQ